MMTERQEDERLQWQSKAVLLLVVPWTVISVVIESLWWARNEPIVAWQALGISAVFGLIVWKMRAATPGGALTGAAITASLMLSTARYPYEWTWLHGGLMPLLAVFVLTYVATKIGRKKKEQLGTAESKRGRNAAQVAANLGLSAIAVQSFGFGPRSYSSQDAKWLAVMAAIAALAEAAADTVSSEIGQVLGGTPRLLTTFRLVEPGTDGGITFAGTAAGILASGLIAISGVGAIFGSAVFQLPYYRALTVAVALAGTFGLLFDSVLGATLERKGWINNDAVNFLSTLSAAISLLVAYRLLFSIFRA